MTDIVERLNDGLYDQDIPTMLGPLLDEAAIEIERLRAALSDNDLYLKTWSEDYDKMKRLLKTAYTVLAFCFDRIHCLPRVRDTELADDIEKVRAQIEPMIKEPIRKGIS